MNKRGFVLSVIVTVAVPPMVYLAQPALAQYQQLTPGPPGGGANWRPGANPWPTSGPGTGNNFVPQNNSWAEQQARNAEMQRQAMSEQAAQPVRPQVLQYQRWQKEWYEQHPGQPLPNMPTLEKMHEGEILNTIQRDGNAMWARRKADVQAQYQMARQMQQSKNAAAHINWNAQQWAAFDREYDSQKRQEAQDYIKNFALSGEMARQQVEDERRRKEMSGN